MAKIRAQRRVIALDMTAMCDMAFLLLTFFMLATNFKKSEGAAVNIPSSVSENKLAESNIMIISVEQNGQVHFGIEGESDRESLLKKISDRYRLDFTDHERREFSHLASFGTSIADLKPLLNATKEQRKKMQKGIPTDSTNNELKEWIRLASLTNNTADIAIKADMDLSYPVVEQIIATLQDLEINKFKLVTSLEAKPK